MGLFGKSKGKSKHQASTSEQPPARDLPPPEGSYGGGGYSNSYDNPQPWPYNTHEPDYDHHGPPQYVPQPPPPQYVPRLQDQYYNTHGSDYYHQSPPRQPPQYVPPTPPPQFVPPPQDTYSNYPMSEPSRQFYPPPPDSTSGPPNPPPPPPPAPTYLFPPPGRTMDEDPNAQCMIM